MSHWLMLPLTSKTDTHTVMSQGRVNIIMLEIRVQNRFPPWM
jgi:hypothetical protein